MPAGGDGGEAPVVAFVGLGSNLGNPQLQLSRAASAIEQTDGILDTRRSSLYLSEPVGYADQPMFVNAVISVRTMLSPESLLLRLLEIEGQLGRERVEGNRNAPRLIDCDLLLYGDESRSAPDLQIPHPRMGERLFVLEPLFELDPGLYIPGMGAVRDLRNRCIADGQAVTRLGDFEGH